MTVIINYRFNTMKIKTLIAFANPQNMASNRIILLEIFERNMLHFDSKKDV